MVCQQLLTAGPQRLQLGAVHRDSKVDRERYAGSRFATAAEVLEILQLRSVAALDLFELPCQFIRRQQVGKKQQDQKLRA